MYTLNPALMLPKRKGAKAQKIKRHNVAVKRFLEIVNAGWVVRKQVRHKPSGALCQMGVSLLGGDYLEVSSMDPSRLHNAVLQKGDLAILDYEVIR